MSSDSHKSNALVLRQALWNLQKEVLNTLKEEFDREVGYQATPTEWFQVLTTAERYTWLRELTSLMADIDVMTELDFITEQHAAVARAEIERLLLNEDPPDETFEKIYRDMLMSGMSLLPLHSHLKAALHPLPKVKMEKAHSLTERKNWAEEHRHQARKKRN